MYILLVMNAVVQKDIKPVKEIFEEYKTIVSRAPKEGSKSQIWKEFKKAYDLDIQVGTV